MRPAALRKLLNYNAVLLAVYSLADFDGLVCVATNKRIGEVTDRTAATVRDCIREMERKKVIRTFGRAHGLSHRLIVLCDHPRATAFARHIKDAYLPSRV